MSYMKDLIVTGVTRCLSKIYAPEFVGKLTGNADSATKLSTPRNIQVNLGSTSSASFDGTSNVSPGVTGVLPVANGGTGTNNGTIHTHGIIDVGSIEMSGGASGTGGYIDFYFANDMTVDHTSRIIEAEKGHINIVTPNGINVDGYVNTASYMNKGVTGFIVRVTEDGPPIPDMLWAW